MLLSTTDTIPGYAIEAVIGIAMGMTANTGRGYGGALAEVFSSKSESEAQTKAAYDGRRTAVERMMEDAAARGANALVGVHFDSLGLATENARVAQVCAYGTAVRVRPLGDSAAGATEQSRVDARRGEISGGDQRPRPWDATPGRADRDATPGGDLGERL